MQDAVTFPSIPLYCKASESVPLLVIDRSARCSPAAPEGVSGKVGLRETLQAPQVF